MSTQNGLKSNTPERRDQRDDAANEILEITKLPTKRGQVWCNSSADHTNDATWGEHPVRESSIGALVG